MKIREVRLTPFKRKLAGNPEDVMVKDQSLEAVITQYVVVEIVSDEGVKGEGITHGGDALAMKRYLENYVAPALIGRDPRNREEIWQTMWRLDRLWFTQKFVIGAVDVALWDLYGKLKDAPIVELLGRYTDRMPIYASSMTKETVEEYVEEALLYKERGFRGYKLHTVGELDIDRKICRAVREAVGDDWPLMVDSVSAFDYPDALKLGRELEELDYEWFEEPLRDYQIDRYRDLAEALDIPIAGTEVNEGSVFGVAPYITARAVDIVRADTAFKQGITATKKIASLAEAHGMRCELHTNGNQLLDAYSLHVACSIPNTRFFEQLVPEALFTFEGAPTIERVDGYALVPTGPGVGLPLDWEWVEANRLD